MKRRSWIAWGLVFLLVLSGCGMRTQVDDSMETNAALDSTEAAPEAMDGIPGNVPKTEASQSTKLIYRGNLELETTDFDDVTAELQDLVERCGGHLQSGNLHHSDSGYRSAEYVVRVPAEQYRAFFTTVGELCHVTWMNEETEDVSMVYYDTAGRLKTQEAKLERLQEFLKKAETMEEIITLESAISETEYTIDSLTGELRHYDDLIRYSTVTISLQEVYQLSNTGEPAADFGDRIGAAFLSGIRGFAGFVGNLAVLLAYTWVWILLAVAILIVVFWIARRRQRGTPIENFHFFHKKKKPQDPKT